MNSLMIHDVLVDSSRIVSGNLALSHSMMGETLAADDLTITIDAGMEAGGFYEGYIPLNDTEPYETADEGVYFVKCGPVETYIPRDDTEPYLTADGEEYLLKILPLDVSTFAPGDEMLYYWDGVLVGKYFLQKMTRLGRSRYKLEATSAVGLLIQSTHNGGVYSDVKAGVIFADILGNIPYTIETALSNAVVYGYLPKASRRDTLQQLLFATGGALFTDNTGKLVISTMNSAIQGDFTAHRCYIGGSVEESDPVPAVDVTEHNYFAAAQQEPDTLLEEGVDGTVKVQFNGPHYDLQCTGGTITESSANHAVITAQGFVTLTGKPYQHITRIVRAGDADAVNNVRTVTNATLANPQIAQALAKRLYQYLQCSKIIREDVLFGNERAGQLVTVCNPYTMEMETAAVTEFDVTMSGVNKAAGRFLVGFTPQGVLSGYQNCDVLTGSGSWTVPPSTNGTIRVTVVGAGSGGNGGYAGKNGESFSDGENDYTSKATTDAETRAGGSGGDEGKAGTGGSGGKIYEFTLAVEPGQVFSYSCGVGGTGGSGGQPETYETITEQTSDPEPPYESHITTTVVTIPEVEPGTGTAGTATVFAGRSSDWGKVYPTGYYKANKHIYLGISGADGHDGGIGGHGGRYPLTDAEAGETAQRGENCSVRDGGAGGVSVRVKAASQVPGNNIVWESGGGGGGGASFAANGLDGADGDDATGGAGGNGANGGTSTSGASPGCGGEGGHGGGGGGGGGAAFYSDYGGRNAATAHAGKPGAGGNGGTAGNGADGAVYIDY